MDEPKIMIGGGEDWTALPASASDTEVYVAAEKYQERTGRAPEIRRAGTPEAERTTEVTFSDDGYTLIWTRRPNGMGSVQVQPSGEGPRASVLAEVEVDIDSRIWRAHLYGDGTVAIFTDGRLFAGAQWKGDGLPLPVPPEVGKAALAHLIALVRTYEDHAVAQPEDEIVASRLAERLAGLTISCIGLRIADDYLAVERRSVMVEMRPYIGHGDFGIVRPPSLGPSGVYTFAVPWAEIANWVPTDILYTSLGAQQARERDEATGELICSHHALIRGGKTMATEPGACSFCVAHMVRGLHPALGVHGKVVSA